VTDELLMGVDIGTSYSKGVVTTLEGTIVARVERAHDVSMPHPGWAEHDADAVWWSTAAPSPGSWRTQPAANAYDAWLAGVTAGLVDETSDWSRITTTIEPDPATSEGFAQLYRSFRDLQTGHEGGRGRPRGANAGALTQRRDGLPEREVQVGHDLDQSAHVVGVVLAEPLP